MKFRTWLFLIGGLGLGCSNGTSAAPAPPCEAKCQDQVMARGVRETLKLVFNLTLQGKPVGPQEATTPCPQGGSARVFGEATSNALQGATDLSLTYVLTSCTYLQLDSDPEESYELTIDGTITQLGVLAVQPTATTALLMRSEALSVQGTVYDPPLPLSETNCFAEFGQSGSRLSGTLCGRTVGLDL